MIQYPPNSARLELSIGIILIAEDIKAMAEVIEERFTNWQGQDFDYTGS